MMRDLRKNVVLVGCPRTFAEEENLPRKKNNDWIVTDPTYTGLSLIYVQHVIRFQSTLHIFSCPANTTSLDSMNFVNPPK